MFSLKRHMELLYCKQDLLLHGKVYISSQTVKSTNSEPKLLLIVLLFNAFPPAPLSEFQKKSPCPFIPSCSLLYFQKKLHPARLFHPALLFDT